MSVGLVVERTGTRGNGITLVEWVELVSKHPDLRIRTDPYFAVAPKTGVQFQINAGEADADILQGEGWEPFLRYRRGKLVTEYQSRFEDPGNVIRIKISAVAKALGAVVTTDLGDEILAW